METIANSPLMAKYINDQMMNLDKAFLLDTGKAIYIGLAIMDHFR